jgi:hypothetical protein
VVNFINQTIDSNNEQLFVKHRAIPPGEFTWKYTPKNQVAHGV